MTLAMHRARYLAQAAYRPSGAAGAGVGSTPTTPVPTGPSPTTAPGAPIVEQPVAPHLLIPQPAPASGGGSGWFWTAVVLAGAAGVAWEMRRGGMLSSA